MRIVSIDELKRNLAALVAAAAGGERIVITKHRRPVASLNRVDFEHLNVGPQADQADLKPLLRGPTHGAYLDALADDRHSSSRDG